MNINCKLTLLFCYTNFTLSSIVRIIIGHSCQLQESVHINSPAAELHTERSHGPIPENTTSSGGNMQPVRWRRQQRARMK